MLVGIFNPCFLVVVVLHLVIGLVPEHEVHRMAGKCQEGHVYVAADLKPVAVVVQTLGDNRLQAGNFEGGKKY